MIESRYCGPPDSANGGYTCGLLAEALGVDAAEVTLWRPPPLDRPLIFDKQGDAGRLLEQAGDEQPVADIHTAGPAPEPPAPPGFEQAVEASRGYAGFDRHPFPGCFVCGPERGEADGLRIFPGPVQGQSIVAAPWMPDAALGDARGRIRPRYLWAALDCPGAFAAIGLGGADWPLLLGRFCVRITGELQAGARAVVIAWRLDGEGRKHRCGSALYNDAGERIATGSAVWIQPRVSTR